MAIELPENIERAMRTEAEHLERLDVDAYAAFGRDPLAPIVGLGPRDATLAIVGRDPGRKEVEMGLPFVGAGGQKVRQALYRRRYGKPPADFQASLEIGQDLFWINTVPYKPQGNKAWSMAVKKRFQPLMAKLLIDSWEGEIVITLGREAFFWFGIGQTKVVRNALADFWADDAKFEATHVTYLATADGRVRRFRLAPLPHPSPLNQRWFQRFPDLLDQRLAALDGLSK